MNVAASVTLVQFDIGECAHAFIFQYLQKPTNVEILRMTASNLGHAFISDNQLLLSC